MITKYQTKDIVQSYNQQTKQHIPVSSIDGTGGYQRYFLQQLKSLDIVRSSFDIYLTETQRSKALKKEPNQIISKITLD